MSKATSTDAESPKTFVPVKIEIVFDNQRDLDTFGAIFNHCVITEFHGGQGSPWSNFCTSIRRAVDSQDLSNPGHCENEDLWEILKYRMNNQHNLK